MWRFQNMRKRVWGIFILRMRRNGYFGASDQKYDPPFAAAIPISVTGNNSSSGYSFAMFRRFLSAHAQKWRQFCF